jgi:hypothetical protein
MHSQFAIFGSTTFLAGGVPEGRGGCRLARSIHALSISISRWVLAIALQYPRRRRSRSLRFFARSRRRHSSFHCLSRSSLCSRCTRRRASIASTPAAMLSRSVSMVCIFPSAQLWRMAVDAKARYRVTCSILGSGAPDHVNLYTLPCATDCTACGHSTEKHVPTLTRTEG